MKNFHALVCGLLALVMVGCEKQPAGDSSPDIHATARAAAVESAQAWLALVDSGNFGQSWENAATLFKSAVTQADWEKAVSTVRTPLGKLVTRKIKSQQYATSLPGAPDGEYVMIQFDTAFEHKAVAVETITPMLDKDGKWRVSGYFIK